MTKTNSIIVGLKLLIPVSTIVILFFCAFHFSNFTSQGFAPMGLQGMLAALPSAGVVFSFIGYSPAIQLAGEVKNPQRSLPIAIIGSLLICIVLYVLLQTVFVGALFPSMFSHGWSQLNFIGDAGPFAGIAVAIGFGWLAKILFIDAAVSPYGTALIYTATAARMCYAMGKNGFLPESLLKLSRHGIPVRVIGLNFLIGLFLFLPFPTWQNMMSFLVSALVFAYAVGPLSLVVLRKTLPQHPRPFRVPLHAVFCFLAFYICNLIVFWTGWDGVSKMLLAIALGYVVLTIHKCTRRGHNMNLQWRKAWWVIVYIVLLSVVTYLGSFGGGRDIIHFGWDFVVVAAISWIIFELSRRCALDTDDTQRQVDLIAETMNLHVPDDNDEILLCVPP